MRPLSRPTGCGSRCTTSGSASMSANTRSDADRPCWNWDQNDAMDVSGSQNSPTL